ncbi:NAD-dependent epimerase/dehydratase family protein [Acinetobacter johnsonii]|uniref:NAD-dependent epimerase/dehydratase family protein n=1 Tax=Acinetobacter johnsonii TaxID=40214 RepID=UPI0028103651|nr:NAD(P)H-binding protein [Acinetobacter johnsonii]MDQ8972991.1 NAD(P)H-binding protein [Acinetobacter johnsonii]
MHILFIGYGKTSQRVAKQLFQQGHQITTISRSPKSDDWAEHLTQDIHQLDLSQLEPIDAVYVLLSPENSTVQAYQRTFVDSIESMLRALKSHPLKRVIVVSSTRVYGESAGERVDDESTPQPSDAQGQVLLNMEAAWQQAYPSECVIVRPTGIYGTSVSRMIKLAQNTKTYPKLHWSNRIHIDDLAAFLAQLLHVEHTEKSYICSNSQPLPLHGIIHWFQQQLGRPVLVLESDVPSGKQIYATRMQQMNFELQHPNCFDDYLALLGRKYIIFN